MSRNVRGFAMIVMVIFAGWNLHAAKAEKEQPRKARAKRLSAASDLKHKEFERKNSDTDLMRGFVTYSVPDESRPYASHVAYVFVRWGDLDKKIPKCKTEYYQNWDGSVEVDKGFAAVAREFAFDDGSGRSGSKKEKAAKTKSSSSGDTESLAAWKQKEISAVERKYEAAVAKHSKKKDSQKRSLALEKLAQWRKEKLLHIDQAVNAQQRAASARKDKEPGQGSGRDKLLSGGGASRVVWKSGVVGATDGLLIRLALKGPTAKGTIKAGSHTIPYAIVPRNAGM